MSDLEGFLAEGGSHRMRRGRESPMACCAQRSRSPDDRPAACGRRPAPAFTHLPPPRRHHRPCPASRRGRDNRLRCTSGCRPIRPPRLLRGDHGSSRPSAPAGGAATPVIRPSAAKPAAIEEDPSIRPLGLLTGTRKPPDPFKTYDGVPGKAARSGVSPSPISRRPPPGIKPRSCRARKAARRDLEPINHTAAGLRQQIAR